MSTPSDREVLNDAFNRACEASNYAAVLFSLLDRLVGDPPSCGRDYHAIDQEDVDLLFFTVAKTENELGRLKAILEEVV